MRVARVLLVALCFAACISPPPSTRAPVSPPPPLVREIPPPQVSYLRSLSGGWRVWLTDDRRAVTTLRYGLTVGPARRLHETLYLRALFDDPRNPTSPLVTETKIEPGMRELLIRSPEVRGLRKGHRYSMRVHIFDDSGRTRLIGVHRETIPARFNVRADGSVSF